MYQKTEYREALRLLETNPQQTGPTYVLTGKCYYMLEDYKKATEALEKAVAVEPDNSSYFNWFGKAYGRRAETSSFLTAPSYASRARKQFERAVELDPNNLEAVGDLFEYYLEAPGFLGGGLENAAALSERIRERDAAKYHSMQARLAEKRKQFAEAERHWRLAAQLAPSQAGRLVDLAKFLARQGRHGESDATFEHAERLAPNTPQHKLERAKTYLQSGRNRELARKWLQEYLNSSLTPEDPPRSEARRLLDKIPPG